MLGIINLGVSTEYFERFKTSIFNAREKNQVQVSYDFNYGDLNDKKIEEIIDTCDTLVLSPGNAKVGLLTPERAERDPGIPPLYELIQKAAERGIPLLGVNAGHQAINCAYGWAIDKIPQDKESPDDEKVDYKKRTTLNSRKPILPDESAQLKYHRQTPPNQNVDPILMYNSKVIDHIVIELSNNYAVLPRDQQRKREGQDKVTQLVDFMGRPLISRVESDAPVYGVQFNIQPGTEQIFKNFFALAKQYLGKK